MSNILLDIPNLKKDHGGVYQYSIALIKILAKAELPFVFFILCHNQDEDIKAIVDKYPNFRMTLVAEPKYNSFQIWSMKAINFGLKFLKIKPKFGKKDLYDKIIEEYKIEIIYTPFQSVVRKPNIKSITTLHDVQELHFPEFFTPAQRAYRAVHYKSILEKADLVVVSYDHIKNDLIKFFHKQEQEVAVILLDMENLWFEKVNHLNPKLLDKFELPEKFLLLPAATWEHKNHLGLIDAISFLERDEIYLICTGDKTDFYFKRIEPYIRVKNLQEKVKFLGIVSDEELFNLYHRCHAVVIPTLYEAGSFPLMESILLEIPVICSNVTSLPATIGNERFIFDPFDFEDIASKILEIWDSKQYRAENKRALRKAAEKIKNNNAGNKFHYIYNELLGIS